MNLKFKKQIDLDKIRHLVLLLLVFFIGLEYWDLLMIGPNFTISKAMGILYFLIGVVCYRSLFVISRALLIPVAVLFLFYFVYLFSALYSHFNLGYEINVQIVIMPVQFILFYSLVLVDVYNNPGLKNKIIISFVLGAVTIYVLLMLGIGIQVGKGEPSLGSVEDITRVHFMGMNPNDLGNLATLGAISAFYLSRDVMVSSVLKFVFGVIVFPLIHLMILSGSLGSLLAMFFGFAIILLDSRTVRLKNLVLILVLMPALFYIINIVDVEFLSRRLDDFLNTGNTSGRTDIWATNLSYMFDHPVIGVGPLSSLRTSHNMFIDAFVWGGFIGLILYLLFIGLVLINSYRQYVFHKNTFYLAIFVVLVFFLLKSGGAFQIKYIWLYLAIASQLPKRSWVLDRGLT